MSAIDEIKNYSGQPLTRQILMDLLQKYRRPYDKINELTKQGILTQVKRGVFIAGPHSSVQAPEKMLLANHLWGPSYVSSDSALSYWGFIPEKVYETISMTTNSAKIFRTPIGRFRYIRLSLPYYSFGLQSVEISARQMIVIAGKEKSLCDKIITTPRLKLRSVRQTRQYLMDDLRITKHQLSEIDTKKIQEYLKDSPKHESIAMLSKTLENL